MRTPTLPSLFLAAACRIFVLGALALANATAAGAPAPAPVPISAFFENAALGNAVLSPDGKSLALLVNGNGGRDRLGVLDLSTNSVKVVAEFADGDVGRFQWVNNKRLVYDSRDKLTAPGDQRYAPGMYAVDRDSARVKRLVDVRGHFIVDGTFGQELQPWNTYLLNQTGAQDSDDIYVTRPAVGSNGTFGTVDLLRLNTVNGRVSTVESPGDTRHWLLDAKGEPRLATVLDENKESVWYLDPATSKWRKLVTFDAFLGGKDAFWPLAFAPDGTLYVETVKDDKQVLAAFDFATNQVKAVPLVRLEQFDFRGYLITSAGKLLGVRYVGDAAATAWFDPKMKAVQASVDALLPQTINLIDVAPRAETPYVLVRSYSDHQPSVFKLFNTATGKLSTIGASHPHIDPARMAAQDLVNYTARDGMNIPAWITMPNNSKGKQLPMVVLVHGGPYMRGNEWGWHPDAQFLASRGYVVLEPEYRGSTGYGAKLFKAGWKQWGLAMQDDIADGTRWAIAQGIADPKRICIAGASYGGYATLMGLIKDPDLYRCGIDWVGVTDIKLLYTGTWIASSDMPDSYKKYGFPTLVGDPVKDADQLAATSPLLQAARIKQPLLLAYGGADKRVPIHHGHKFYDAVKQTNKDVEWVEYDGEGHGWLLPATRVDFWTRVEKFLDRNIGKP